MRKLNNIIAIFALFGMLLAACSPGANTTATATSSVPNTGLNETSTPLTGTTPTAAMTSAATTAATTAATMSTSPTAAATSMTTGTPAATTTGATPTITPPAGQTPSANLRTPEQAALDAAGGQKIGGSVTFLGPWGGSEQASLMAMLKPFEDATGITVNYTGSRDESAILVTQVQGGNPPDLADFANPGQISQFEQQGKLVDLSSVIDMNTYSQNYAKTWVDLGTYNGKFVAVVIKAATKGLIWYDPKVWASNNFQVPQTWDELMALSQKMANTGTTPWCMAVENGAASGWPGTDWIEDIVLRQNGIDFYNKWWSGQVAWTSPEIKKAFQTWGALATDPKMVYGGPTTVLTTNFQNVGDPLFKNPPGCFMAHQASFIADSFVTNTPGLKPGTDFTFFPFPSFAGSELTVNDRNGRRPGGDVQEHAAVSGAD